MPNDTTTQSPREVSGGRRGLLAGGSVAAIAIAIATPFIAAWEGGRQRDGSAIVYADRLAHNIATACNGSTGTDQYGNQITVGHRYTSAECDEMLRRELVTRIAQIRPCLPDNISAEGLGASLSLAYNIGSRNFCRSSASARFRAGNYRAACDAFLVWNRSAGVVRTGLVRRRAAERALCLRGAA